MRELFSQSAYDDVPYESHCYVQTHPQSLYTVAKFFGVQAPDFKQCRVLELGCASGGNILPLAIDFPESSFVGVDLSEVQIDAANVHKKELVLENIEFKQMSIADITKKFGTFDYIIVHGILSWVPKQVQEAIFRVCNENLSENGVAYVSYNTLPGWNMVKSVRDMMLFHTQNFKDPKEKAQQARLLLNFINEGTRGKENPYKQFIENEINMLKNTGDSYILHDHMEEVNHPFYFHEFMKHAVDNDLSYLGDVNIASMFTGNMPEETVSVLSKVKNDIIKTEQYMDFINNRRFRSSLLCKKDVKMNRNVDSDSLEGLFIKGTIEIAKGDETKPLAGQEVSFKCANGATFTTAHPMAVCGMSLIKAQSGKPIAIETLCNTALEDLEKLGLKASDSDAQQMVSIFKSYIVKLVLSGGFTLSSDAPEYCETISEKPEISQLARYQAKTSNWVTNRRYEKITLDVSTRVMVQYLDGTKNKEQLIEFIDSLFTEGKLKLSDKDGKPQQANAKEIVEKALESFVKTALLVT